MAGRDGEPAGGDGGMAGGTVGRRRHPDAVSSPQGSCWERCRCEASARPWWPLGTSWARSWGRPSASGPSRVSPWSHNAPVPKDHPEKDPRRPTAIILINKNLSIPARWAASLLCVPSQ